MFEVYLILWLMGHKVSPFSALGMEALTKLINVAGAFNPGNIGTYEAGTALIARLFGLSVATGLALALIRRFRAIAWTAAGSLCLMLLSRSRSLKPASSPLNVRESRSPHVAVILANDLHAVSSGGWRLPQVGMLPVLLRAILAAEKAGATRIAVATNPGAKLWVRHDLQSTGRLPETVEWFELGKRTPLSSILIQLADQAEQRVVVVDGDKTYHPSLYRQASEWGGDADAFALTTAGELAGIYVLSSQAISDLFEIGPPNIIALAELHTWHLATHSVEYESAARDKWQRVANPGRSPRG